MWKAMAGSGEPLQSGPPVRETLYLTYAVNEIGEIGHDNSSRRYKINIETLQDDWSKILKTRPVRYNRPSSPEYDEFGYIAEEMDSIGLTNLVAYDEQGLPEDVCYNKMILYLTEMLNIQVEKTAELEQRLECCGLKD